jgi:hypothetical protein
VIFVLFLFFIRILFRNQLTRYAVFSLFNSFLESDMSHFKKPLLSLPHSSSEENKLKYLQQRNPENDDAGNDES